MIEGLNEITQQIIAQADIVSVISHFVKLERKGKNYRCLCPFHDDKSLGNFSISKEKGIFKCYSCGVGGNAITFVQKYTNCTFPEAVKKTAEIIGFNDDRLNASTIVKKVDPKIENLRNCLKDIATFYESSLFFTEDGKEALEYLHNRGLTDENIKYFNIGYAQTNGNNIVDFLKSKNYSLKTIEEAGIIRLDSSHPGDINAGRITFAIKDKDGYVVGFSCRKFRESDKSDSKYINTSSTTLFNKSQVLYNYYNALNESKRVNYVYVLEGFMDVIACHKIGIKSAIGLMGTALTVENIQLLRYLKCEVRICLDLDDPGQRNAYKIGKLLADSDIPYKMVNNKVDFKEKDTDEILKSYGEEELNKYLANLVLFGEWQLNYFESHLNLDSLDGKRKLLDAFIPYLVTIKNQIDYEYYVQKLSSLTGFDKQIIKNAAKKYFDSHKNSDEKSQVELDLVSAPMHKKSVSKLELAESQALKYIVENKDAFYKYRESLGYFINPIYKDIANLIEEYINTNNDKDYDVKELISFVYISNFDDAKTQSLIDGLTQIAIGEMQIPPYTPEIFNEIIETINSQKKEQQLKQRFKQQISQNNGQSTVEFAKNYFNSKKDLINSKNKNRGGTNNDKEGKQS